MTAAAALFLDAVLVLEAEGWLRGFLDALVAAGGCRSRGGFARTAQRCRPVLPGPRGAPAAVGSVPVLPHQVRCPGGKQADKSLRINLLGGEAAETILKR